MKNQIIKTGIIALVLSLSFSACKKDPAPVPDEQELITTVKIHLTEETSSFMQTFEYKVENGFGGTAGSISIDTIKLKPNTKYSGAITVLNEKASPVENITTEILEKDDEHLFLFASTPDSGKGSLMVSDGSKDKNGKPFNQTFTLTSGGAGTGKFDIQLMHQPTDKNGTTPATSGGETDLAASYPVVLQ